ncbi:MAG: hypothetical protein NUV97_01350, partial [archaeon]|nr:hypothetical protein [archaeon]
MARYDLVLIENTAVTGVDFEEKLVNITRGGLLTATADANRLPAWKAVGTNGQILSTDGTDLTWVAQSSIVG